MHKITDCLICTKSLNYIFTSFLLFCKVLILNDFIFAVVFINLLKTAWLLGLDPVKWSLSTKLSTDTVDKLKNAYKSVRYNTVSGF